MSTNTELIRASYAAFRRGDIDAATALFDPGIEWTHPDGMEDYGLGGTKKGIDEVRAFMARARTVFSELRQEPREFLESGDRVVVIGVHHMRGARSGVTGTVRFVHTWRLADGRATHFEDHHDTYDVRRIVDAGDAAHGDGADSPGRIVQTGLAFWQAKTLHTAVELRLFTELAAAGPLDAGQLRTRLGLHGRGLRDFLDGLVSMGLLEREDGRYHNLPGPDAFLDEAKPDGFIGGLLEVASQQWWQPWSRLGEALRTGERQNNVHGGEDPFTALYSDPERARRFQRAMTGGSTGSIAALIDRLPWSEHRTVADVGCSEGALLSRVLRAHEHLTGIGFDLPVVEPLFGETVAEAGLGDRLSFQAGDFFADPLPQADLIVFGHVLHDWDLETKRMLLRKAYEALPDGGRVVVYEALIDDGRRHNTFALMMSLHMLVESSGGFDYTGADCRGWMAEAGFRNCYVQHLAGPESMIVGIK
ncbi:methyltransferase [Allosalinactinospora lopnorensis]|uniref:methyltransferase n=1 Tax=Allosalinactinospora lopnorensis TaxID=1352348 RepID=UPI0009E5055E|nr:methyltransferase [Allosalinactinospora lopnorensis]